MQRGVNCLFKHVFMVYLFLGLLFLSSCSYAVNITTFELKSLKTGAVLQKSIKGKVLNSTKKIKGSECKILINAPAKKVWQILDEKENLPRIVRQITEASIIEDNGNHQRVRTSVKICRLLPSFDYILDFDKSEKFRRMKFRKTSGCFNELYGYFDFIPYGDSTILGYRIYSDPGFYIPEFITSGLKDDVKDIMRSIKNEAER